MITQLFLHFIIEKFKDIVLCSFFIQQSVLNLKLRVIQLNLKSAINQDLPSIIRKINQLFTPHCYLTTTNYHLNIVQNIM